VATQLNQNKYFQFFLQEMEISCTLLVKHSTTELPAAFLPQSKVNKEKNE
jgi:hypothetical protein